MGERKWRGPFADGDFVTVSRQDVAAETRHAGFSTQTMSGENWTVSKKQERQALSRRYVDQEAETNSMTKCDNEPCLNGEIAGVAALFLFPDGFRGR